ncbi:FAS1-like dehydratase domain-containing protein [Thetidibacter halocola]|uniref:MaoC family dehydratase N-terminal domain-containing protein n=1 Tax=Thetidibacter halocola TaxID=2827239 RepID=A0A8J7WCA5_9RHOB|nr:MaoC family dehydratase N-terminal domain-containing protein [Thetidibacter halocola]MBS0123794.1 MaoC family dehydratase N-terminal domain-containing protein [Thetidibacter halocola]
MDIDHLRSWIGTMQEDSETLSPTTLRQFNATFDRQSSHAEGAVAPLLIHLCLAQPIAPMSALGRDGHPALGGFMPPVPLPRRMWAGGEFTFLGDIRVGQKVTRRSTVTDVQLKQGRTGALCFVTVEHAVTADGQPVLTERQDIVYRDVAPASAGKAEPPPAPEGTHRRVIEPTSTLLFRYSALTFNGHRIHYDKPFCIETEGYPGLVVHGPMQATMLCQMAADLRGARPATFSFRSLSPIFDDAYFTLNAKDRDGALHLWTARQGGPVAMEATATW